MIRWEPEPTAVGVYVTEQLDRSVSSMRMQVGLLKVPPPGIPPPSVVQVTVPSGAVFFPLSVSRTVAVHEVDESTGMVPGVQVTVVVVVRLGGGAAGAHPVSPAALGGTAPVLPPGGTNAAIVSRATSVMSTAAHSLPWTPFGTSIIQNPPKSA